MLTGRVILMTGVCSSVEFRSFPNAVGHVEPFVYQRLLGFLISESGAAPELRTMSIHMVD